jgi:hypothetical protein
MSHSLKVNYTFSVLSVNSTVELRCTVVYSPSSPLPHQKLKRSGEGNTINMSNLGMLLGNVKNSPYSDQL